MQEKLIRELEEKLQRLQQEEKEIRVEVVQGRQGGLIGVVRYTSVPEEVPLGLVVLFSDSVKPKLQLYRSVYLKEYQVRVSNRTGRKYVKAFSVFTEEEWTMMKEAKQREIDRIKMQIRKLKDEKRLKSNVKNLVDFFNLCGVFISEEEAVKIASLDFSTQRNIIVALLKRNNVPVIQSSFNIRVPLENQDIELSTGYVIELEKNTYPVNDIPFGEMKSGEYGIIFIDDCELEEFQAREMADVLAEKGYRVYWWGEGSGYSGGIALVLRRDSEVYKKLIAVKNTEIPPFIKRRIYAEVLHLDTRKLVEVVKNV